MPRWPLSLYAPARPLARRWISATPPAQFPEESSGETYVGSEHFMVFTPRASIDDAGVKNAPASYGWTRIGPWLPWMKMGTREGNLLYIAQGHKIAGIEELPDDMQALIKARYPQYARARGVDAAE